MSVKIISTIYYIYWVIVYAILSVKGFLIQLLYKEEIVLFYKYWKWGSESLSYLSKIIESGEIQNC